MEKVNFTSNGIRCSALLYKRENAPIIVIAGGLGSTKEMRMNSYAEKFYNAGFSCLVFDYRNFGESDGSKRQRVNIKEQIDDWNSAITYVKNRRLSNEIYLFGTCLSGGHVIKIGATREDIKGVISQCPFLEPKAFVLAMPFITRIKLNYYAMIDNISSFFGMPTVMVRLSGNKNTASIITVHDNVKYNRMSKLSKTFVNKTPAKTIRELKKYNPSKHTKDINIPIFYAICKNDTVIPYKSSVSSITKTKKSTIKEYDFRHFDFYFDNEFELSTSDYIEFIQNLQK